MATNPSIWGWSFEFLALHLPATFHSIKNHIFRHFTIYHPLIYPVNPSFMASNLSFCSLLVFRIRAILSCQHLNIESNGVHFIKNYSLQITTLVLFLLCVKLGPFPCVSLACWLSSLLIKLTSKVRGINPKVFKQWIHRNIKCYLSIAFFLGCYSTIIQVVKSMSI